MFVSSARSLIDIAGSESSLLLTPTASTKCSIIGPDRLIVGFNMALMMSKSAPDTHTTSVSSGIPEKYFVFESPMTSVVMLSNGRGFLSVLLSFKNLALVWAVLGRGVGVFVSVLPFAWIGSAFAALWGPMRMGGGVGPFGFCAISLSCGGVRFCLGVIFFGGEIFVGFKWTTGGERRPLVVVFIVLFLTLIRPCLVSINWEDCDWSESLIGVRVFLHSSSSPSLAPSE